MPVTRIEFGRIKGRGDGQRENNDERVLGVFRASAICTQNKTPNSIYKIMHTCSIGPKYLDDMFTIKNTTYNMRNTMKLIVPNPETVKYSKRSFKYEGSRLWNLLTYDTKLVMARPRL